jgi:hypothetical protein
MALSAFDDKSLPPRDDELEATLGAAFAWWRELQLVLAARFAPLSLEWGFTSKATGWGARLRHDKRIVLYLLPCEGYFLASFVLGERAVRAARDSDLPYSVVQAIDTARMYAEGRGVRLEVRSAADVPAIERLVAIKLAN